MPPSPLLRVTAACLVFVTAPFLRGQSPDLPIYRQPTAPIEQRVTDLLARMTPAEKLAQISSQWIPPAVPAQATDEFFGDAWLREKLASGIGTIGPCHLPLDEDVALRNRIQHFLKTQTRLGIPTFFHDEACHGLMKPEATSFPAPIGLACSWDESLVEKLYDLAARETRSRGAHHVLAPVVDVTLDPRWGRTDETLGEDPFLNARLGAAMVRGLQGGSSGLIDGSHVMATLKHLAGHGASEGGLNRSPVHIGPHDLRETHLAPFAYIIKTARPAAIMPSYNEIDGIPSHANRPLLIDIVRGEYGFTGLFVSDYDGVVQLAKNHHVAASPIDAARLALDTGIQMELPIPETFSQLAPLLATDPPLATLVDDAVRAVLRRKFQLGLFEAPDADAAAARAIAADPASHDLALQAARESIVLLKNDSDLLPLTVGAHKRIAVIGPNANVARLGSYSGIPTKTISLVEGLRNRVGPLAEIVHAEGCQLANQDTRDAYRNWKEIIDVAPADPAEDRRLVAKARALAETADLVILALGENEVVSRESWARRKLGDRASLDLIGAQNELAASVLATGKPVILYLSNGRPISLGALADRFPAIIEGWYAGQETGRAAAEILFGDVNPSAKLTISFPQSAGHLPAQYRRKPYSAPFTYLFTGHDPLFPFGHGLSYTRFAYSAPRLSRTRLAPDEHLRIAVDLTNTGSRPGVEIAQLYLCDDVSSVTRPTKELRGFQRVLLQPGETRAIAFELTPDDLAFYDRSLHRVVEPGSFRVLVGGSSLQTQEARFEVVASRSP